MRPKVVVYGVTSLDSRLTLSPNLLLLFGDERWEAVAGSGEMFDWLLRIHNPEAQLEGSNSFVRDDCIPEPLPPVVGDHAELYHDFVPENIAQRPGHRGWFVVVDSRGRVRWAYTGEPGKEAPGSEGWHLLLLVAHCTPAEYLAYLQRENVPYLVAGQERVDLAQALERLASRLGVRCVLTTSPGKLGGALLRAGLVDEVNVEIFPALIGGMATPTMFDSPELRPDEWPTRLRLISAQVQEGGRVWLRYQVIGA